MPRIYYNSEGEGSMRSKEDTQPEFMCHHALILTCLGHAFKKPRILWPAENWSENWLCLCLHNPLSLIQKVTNYGFPGTVPILYLEVLHPPKPYSHRQNGKDNHPTTLVHGDLHSCRMESEGVKRKREPDWDSLFILLSLAVQLLGRSLWKMYKPHHYI